MAEKKLIELFKESAERLTKKANNNSSAIHTMGGYGEIEHLIINLYKRNLRFDDIIYTKIK